MPPILHPDAAGIADAAETVLRGGVIAYPTETVYGLGVNPFDLAAMERLYRVKGRDAGKSVILLVHAVSHLDQLVSQIPDPARILIGEFWPGPLTLVFQANPTLPSMLRSPRNTIALRQSSSPVARRLVEAIGGPVTSTSANLEGRPPARSAAEAARLLGEALDLVLDGGPSPGNLSSTLVDVTVSCPTVLREGVIPAHTIRDVLSRR